MREPLRFPLMRYFRSELLKIREALHVSQEVMAHILAMSVRNYTDLEGGKACFGLITLLFFLRRCCIDPRAFMEGLLDPMDNS